MNARATRAPRAGRQSRSEERAPYELGEALHGALARQLVQQLKGSPSAALLSCTRGFLHDQGIAGQAQTDKQRRELQRILRLYIEALQKALTEGEPQAALLAEVGKFLHRAGIVNDLGGRLDAALMLEQFTEADLPFMN